MKEWVILTKVANDFEFEMVAGLLKIANIPAVKEVKGVDGFLKVVIGVPLAGIWVKVPDDRYDEALALINSNVDEDFLEEEEKNSEENSSKE